ncbi:RND family efflux transporter, MFP subunit [Cognatiyoonia koreensis]|uniref:RND family efflux transporter, MFP subunit n=1 Tax=Cognatiyoonia koreensis TaxID=364200 RepID=A0A1I0RDQ5_9RHOB|nr:efflux transporter periplasmic adaptor subunit [Cognatiyoonia koreensis]SEW38871.1 RND family efflux transporter, MFP subunit [Cognatiyoonia koreensis]
MRFLRRSLLGVFLLSITLALLAFAGNTVRVAVQDRMNAEPRSFPERERVFAVNIVEIEPQTIEPVLTVFGELRSQRSIDLRSAVGGTVLEADPSLIEGGVVTAGQLLMRIDPKTAQASRDRVAADLQDAQAELRDAERGLVLAEDELTAAQAQAELRAQALTRARDLETRGVGTTAAVETAELAESSANAAVLSRRQALAGAEARVDQAATRLARAEIDLAEADRALDETEIFAVFDGTLSDVTVALGGRVTPNERFATLLDPTQLEVAFRVSTSQYARLLSGEGNLIAAPIKVMLDASGIGIEASGVITREGAAVGAGQTGRLIFARLDSAAGFRPGDFVTVSVNEPALDNVALVPATAVAADGTVLVVNDEDRLEVRQTEVKRRQGDDVIIAAAGLVGERIVAERSPLLGAGIGVRPITGGESMDEPAAPETVVLDAERRAKLVAFVTDSRMPEEAKTRLIGQLEQDEVPAETIARLESRMGT